MSLYTQAMVSGMNALTGAQADQIYTSTYNQVYAQEAQKANIRNAMGVAQTNVAAIKADQILTNTQIRMNQDEAEARAIVNAAAAGVEGGSVDDIVYDTERNAAFATNAANQQAEQEVENQLAQIGSGTSALLAVDDDLQEISVVNDLMGAFSSFEMGDLEISDALSSEGYALSSLWSN